MTAIKNPIYHLCNVFAHILGCERFTVHPGITEVPPEHTKRIVVTGKTLIFSHDKTAYVDCGELVIARYVDDDLVFGIKLPEGYALTYNGVPIQPLPEIIGYG